MNYKGLFIFLIAFIVLIKQSIGFGFEKTISASKFTNQLNARIPVLMKKYDIPGVNVALIEKGKIIWSKAYGYANLEQNIKMEGGAYCRVESISKSITAWGVMKLAQKGKIDLDQPVLHYLKNWKFPNSPFPSDKITIRQLLSHSAGLPLGTIGVRYSPTEELPSLKESLYKDAVLNQQPGVSFSYSNTGFNLLELLIEEVTGRAFVDYMQDEVLNPLGMHHSSFEWNTSFDSLIPLGYDLKGNAIPVYVYPDKASGGLFATVEDIAVFITAGMSDFSKNGLNVLDSSSIHQLYMPAVEVPGLYGLAFSSYGLGHFIEQLNNGQKVISHGGQGSGWMTQFYAIPETGDAMVILTNSQRSWPFFAHIFGEWAEWLGFGPLGLERLTSASITIWIMIGLILFTVIWRVVQLARGIYSHQRKFSPLSMHSRSLRFIQVVFFIALISVLLWSLNQDYLFLASVFPIATNWLGLSMLLLAITLLFSALFPTDRIKKVQ